MKNAIFISVRKDSNRLSDKCMLPILGQPVLQLVVKRALQAKKFHEVIVCTTTREIDDEVVEIAEQNGAKTYRGSLDDKLDRWNKAAETYGIDYIVTFDGDDLFCDPYLLDTGLEQMITRDLDFIESPDGMIIGAFSYGMSAKALAQVCHIKASDHTEMMWTYFKDTGLFQCGTLENIPERYFNHNVRATLDYPEDYKFFLKVFDHFKCENNDVGIDKISAYLAQHPEITSINIARQQDFLSNQKAKTHLELKKDIIRQQINVYSNLKLIVFDFDGVMTDNRVLVDQNGLESVWVNRSDGLGVQMIKQMGIRMIILSTESNPVVSVRAKKLELDVLQSINHKEEALINFCNQEEIPLEDVMYVGNDVNDLPAMKLAGIKVVPNDAYSEVKNIADITLNTKGGYGVIRELAALLIEGEK